MITFSPIYNRKTRETYFDLFSSASRWERRISPGDWNGTAVPMLGLTNPVTLPAFENLLNGFTPDGTKALAPDAGRAHRLGGWRLRLTAPTQLSYEWSVASPPSRLRIERAVAQAANTTLTNTLLQLPNSDPEVQCEPRHRVLALFHSQVAAEDGAPQLQATGLLFNLGFGTDGKVHPLNPMALLRREGKLNERFRSYIAHNLEKQTRPIHWLNLRQKARLLNWESKLRGWNASWERPLIRLPSDRSMRDSYCIDWWRSDDPDVRATFEQFYNSWRARWPLARGIWEVIEIRLILAKEWAQRSLDSAKDRQWKLPTLRQQSPQSPSSSQQQQRQRHTR